MKKINCTLFILMTLIFFSCQEKPLEKNQVKVLESHHKEDYINQWRKGIEFGFLNSIYKRKLHESELDILKSLLGICEKRNNLKLNDKSLTDSELRNEFYSYLSEMDSILSPFRNYKIENIYFDTLIFDNYLNNRSKFNFSHLQYDLDRYEKSLITILIIELGVDCSFSDDIMLRSLSVDSLDWNFEEGYTYKMKKGEKFKSILTDISGAIPKHVNILKDSIIIYSPSGKTVEYNRYNYGNGLLLDFLPMDSGNYIIRNIHEAEITGEYPRKFAKDQNIPLKIEW
ncbi:hypothetical protein [Aureibacter tunicatorum]|uniref:Lipoprotein n=1 Tax=Aureibacter tunicatorum TaxID=866807 RepID=A0AAE3XQH7_9BACT|nr:hypothetical protein [Aureibacter tunicatorum]MDR6240061.1 hypothetical protein [Aureibacter tunicatorum]BDD04533.1 hypothetical protein AUTU_20160 [Aureibacter tunicatorum]